MKTEDLFDLIFIFKNCFQFLKRKVKIEFSIFFCYCVIQKISFEKGFAKKLSVIKTKKQNLKKILDLCFCFLSLFLKTHRKQFVFIDGRYVIKLKILRRGVILYLNLQTI